MRSGDIRPLHIIADIIAVAVGQISHNWLEQSERILCLRPNRLRLPNEYQNAIVCDVYFTSICIIVFHFGFVSISPAHSPQTPNESVCIAFDGFVWMMDYEIVLCVLMYRFGVELMVSRHTYDLC